MTGRDVDDLSSGGFRNVVGWKLVTWDAGYAELVLDIEEMHINRAGVVHGGVLMAMLDSAGGYAGCWAPAEEEPRMCVTLSWATNFISPAQLGERILARGRVRGGGRRIFAASAEIVREDGETVATGEGMFRYVDGR